MIRTIVRGEDVEPIATLTVQSVVRGTKSVFTTHRHYHTFSPEFTDIPWYSEEDCLNIQLKTSSGRTLDLQVAISAATDFQIGATFDLIPRPKD